MSISQTENIDISKYPNIQKLTTRVSKRVIININARNENNSLSEIKELIFNYSKQFRQCSLDELKDCATLTEIDWLLNYDDTTDKDIDYNTYLAIIKTVLFIKENYERYSLFDKASFFDAYSFCGGIL